MPSEHATGRLAHIPTDKIQPNPDNPRLTFRQGELEELQESIRQYGIQVPLTVFKRGSEYFLIDGERRWRCASKLNLPTVPALIQQEPKPLDNLLLMFNIHALREQWDLLTIALKLPRVIDLLRKQFRHEPNEGELATKTGLTRSVVRRCRLLMDLPERYKDLLLSELKKPKSKQSVSEDLFIEIERALKTVYRAMPSIDVRKDAARDTLVRKYQNKAIENITDIRKVAKIARSPQVGVDADLAESTLQRFLTDPKYPIGEAWNETISEAYAERDVASRIDHLLDKLEQLNPHEIDDDVREKLQELVDRAKAILEADE
jgi:ParB family chromosome partitioning protein